MKISKKMSKIITIITIILGILFATAIVLAADSYVMPSSVRTTADEYPIRNLDRMIQECIQPIFLLVFIIILTWTIVLIRKNIKAGKNKNQIIKYGIGKLLWIGILLFIPVCFLFPIPSSAYAIGTPDESIGELITHCILYIITILLLIPQMITIKNLRKNLKGIEVKAIQKKEGNSNAALIIGIIIIYGFMILCSNLNYWLFYGIFNI